jgi:hypothetical protein
MLKNWTGIIAIITILFVGSSPASAQEPAEEEVFPFLQEAFESQLSLGESHHTMGEIQEILDPYFTKEYQDNFLEEHLFEEKEGYITYGTDFPAYYIPFFSYTDETKIVEGKDGVLIVYEFFPSDEDMPSLYDDHYEFVKLLPNESGWKVMEWGFDYNEPDFIEGVVSVSEEKEMNLGVMNQEVLISRMLAFGVIVAPFNNHSYKFYAPLKAARMLQEKHYQSFLVAR